MTVLAAGPDFAVEHAQTAQVLRDRARAEGYVVLHGAPVNPSDPRMAAEWLLELARHIGDPVSHDEHDSFVWDIQATPAEPGDVQTYSAHARAAPLHTDSQYRDDPEHVFALLCLVPAACGGGDSLVMSRADLISAVAAQPGGAKALETLRAIDLPFAVPNVFARGQEGRPEFVFAPVLGPGGIRFRADALTAGLAAFPELETQEVRAAINTVTAVIARPTARVRLSVGDLLVIDNREVLHGRMAFTDTRRHLLRVRMRWTDE